MGHKASRLVHHQYLGILVDNLKRHGLRGHRQPAGGSRQLGELGGDLFFPPQFIVRFDLALPDGHQSLLNRPLNHRPGENRGQMPRQKAVKPQPRFGSADHEVVAASHLPSGRGAAREQPRPHPPQGEAEELLEREGLPHQWLAAAEKFQEEAGGGVRGQIEAEAGSRTARQRMAAEGP
jgi:hypothetical protein